MSPVDPPERSRPAPAGCSPSATSAVRALTALLIALSCLAAPEAAAQQPAGDIEGDIERLLEAGAEALPQSLRERLSQREARLLRERLAAKATGAPRAQTRSVAGRAARRPVQSFATNPNPDPRLNLGRTFESQLRRAGDVNGDGTADYLYVDDVRLSSLLITRLVRDERTPALEDYTGKSIVIYGGEPASGQDQFFYRSLRPVGDLDGDGYADAVAYDAESKSVTLFFGSENGYQESGITRSLSIDFSAGVSQAIRGFTDIDGDGTDDLVFVDTLPFSGEGFEVLYGAETRSEVETRLYNDISASSTFTDSATLNTADLDGDGKGEMVYLSSGSGDLSLQVFAVDASRNLQTVQQLDPTLTGPEPPLDAGDFQLSLPDLTGNGVHEIVLNDPAAPRLHALEASTSDGLAYDPSATAIEGPTTAVPVGDLNQDGRHDFYTVDPATGTPHFSYGPDALADGLSFDTEVPTDEGESLDPSFLPSGRLGDVTGDDRPDLLASLSDDPVDELGRRFVDVALNGAIDSVVDVRFPQAHIEDEITSTNEIGDVNGDGVQDFAVVRTDLDQVEVYHGGASISEQPSQTLQVPSDTLAPVTVRAGDVTGDGSSDVVVGYRAGERIDVYEGGAGLSATPDRTIRAEDAGVEALYRPQVVGDVNADGTADIAAPNHGVSGGEAPERLHLFFGGSSLSGGPDRTIRYNTTNASTVPTALGDVNGDGVDDLAVGRPGLDVDGETAEGRVDVYFGGSGAAFEAPDLTIRPETPDADIREFGQAVAGGDFDGDGVSDVAVRPSAVDASGSVENVTLSVYHGGDDLDAVPDQRLAVPAAAAGARAGGTLDGNGDGLADEGIGGGLEAVPGPEGAADGLLLSGADEAVNALVYRPAVSDAPTEVLEAPNQDADLGGEDPSPDVALGDFTGSGTPDAVLVQSADNNDAALSSRFYRYEVDAPSAAAAQTVDADETVSFAGTGVSIGFAGTNGTAGEVVVQRFASGPRDPSGIDEAAVSDYRLAVGADPELSFDTATLRLRVSSFAGIRSPGDVVVYRRSVQGTGAFTALDTQVDENGTPDDRSDDVLEVTTSTFSEFVLASDASPLPVELTALSARASDGEAVLTWRVASETGNAGFAVQRRVFGAEAPGSWTRAGFVASKAEGGTTRQPTRYRFVDGELPFAADSVRYRLRQVDADGRASTSRAVTITRGVRQLRLLGAAPNPARQTARIRVAIPERADVSVGLYDLLGRRVRILESGPVPAGRSEIRADVSGLPSGTYFLRLKADGRVQTKRLTVVR